MRVAAIQHDIVWEDPAANFAHLAPLIAGAAAADARLVVLTEMYSTGFSMHTDRIAEPVDGPSASFLVERAREHGIWICGSVPEVHPGDERPANTLVLVEPDGVRHRYRKIHPFTYGGEHEKYSAGKWRVTVDVEGVRCSLFVCYDLRFADEFWALAPGTDCYVVVANWPAPRRDHWATLLRARAIENQAYVVGVNRVGRGGRLEYVGDSAVIGPFGEVVAEASEGAGEETLLAEVDPAIVASARAEFPFLADRS
ncbi:MAG: carbon-nitrogen family hydrolase [Acidimicrobiia bacterium]